MLALFVVALCALLCVSFWFVSCGFERLRSVVLRCDMVCVDLRCCVVYFVLSCFVS